MPDLPDFLSDFEQEQQAKRRLPRATKKQLDDPLANVKRNDARRAANPQGRIPSMAGKQLRRGVLIPPEMDEEINQLVAEYGIKKMEFMRYLLAVGLRHVHEDGLEGDMVETVSVGLELPKWRRGK